MGSTKISRRRAVCSPARLMLSTGRLTSGSEASSDRSSASGAGLAVGDGHGRSRTPRGLCDGQDSLTLGADHRRRAPILLRQLSLFQQLATTTDGASCRGILVRVEVRGASSSRLPGRSTIGPTPEGWSTRDQNLLLSTERVLIRLHSRHGSARSFPGG
jgi:hypothetical protein